MRTKYLIIVLLVFISAAFITKAKGQCAACQYATDLITNGNFSSGNTGFSSDLNYATGFFCPLCPEDTYAIGANATFYHNDFTGSDHTNPPFGNYYIANGPGQASTSVWCQSFPVQPGVDYTFTFWARDVTNNSEVHPYALLQASFNGVIVDDTLIADGGWTSYSTTWTSDSETFLDLCIINQQSNTGGNDFGLDDISLTACQNYVLSQIPFAGDNQTLCSNVSLQLGQTPLSGYSYSWENTNGLSAIDIANPILFITNTGPSDIIETYILTTDSAGVGCVDSDTVIVTIAAMPAFTLGQDLLICPGQDTLLDAGTGWESITWQNNESTQTLVATAGIYSATVTYNNCTALDEIAVLLTDMPNINLGPDTSFCEDSSIILNAGVIGTWSDGTFSDTYIVSDSGEYYFSYTDGSCVASDTVNATMFTLPIINLQSEASFCQGSTLTLSSSVSGLWSTGDIDDSITIADGGYYDIVITNGPCISSAGTEVTMLPLPSVMLGDDTSICEDNELELSAYSDFNQYYLWSTGDTLASIIIQQPGTYTVDVGNQCDTISAEINIDSYPCSWNLFIPSSFTPNDDNINESWIVQGYNVTGVKISVYNRFGDLIFYAPDLGLPWHPSTGIGDDVYNYTVEAISFEGKEIEQHGHIYLLR